MKIFSSTIESFFFFSQNFFQLVHELYTSLLFSDYKHDLVMNEKKIIEKFLAKRFFIYS
jgi:hypothetical protein